MTFRASHTTTYRYEDPVAICHNEVRLQPRNTARQTVLDFELLVTPEPGHFSSRLDYYGNEVTFFAVDEPHSELTISAVSTVSVHPLPAPDAALSPPWEEVRDLASAHPDAASLDAAQYVFPSQYVKCAPDFAEFAGPSFPARRPVLEGVLDLAARIHRQFRYAPKATTIATPVEESLSKRHGVCQDFAHVMISALRSLGLPARYVSGYIRSSSNAVGSEDSHAWLSAWCPGFGWFDIDPTNNVVPAGDHLTLAWGRDYADVTPVKGVALGGGEQAITVAVRVVPTSAG